MYPNLYFFFKKTLGVDWTFLSPVNTFGFFVALAFLSALLTLYIGLKQKQEKGCFTFTEKIIIIGKPATSTELLIQFFVGFVIGAKIVGIFEHSYYLDGTQLFNPLTYIFSFTGNIYGGVLLGTLLTYLKWVEKKRKQLPKPKKEVIKLYPKDKVNDLLMLAFVFGFLGAKIFHHLENWSDFMRDPWGSILNLGGLTFYGGLICAAVAIIIYSRYNKIPILHLVDTFAPAMMIAYGVGRLGCHFSGDGDWGILNSAYVSGFNGEVMLATAQDYQQALINNTHYYQFHFDSLSVVPAINFKANLLPQWAVAQNFPNNVISEGFKMDNCVGPYCSYLPVPVFPTSLYEFWICFILFVVLWSIRNKMKITGQLAAVYFIMNGVERFFIEKIRVNSLYHIRSFAFTQAELISVILIIIGIILFMQAKKLQPTKIQ